jgi:hypothetical protein
MLTTKFTIDDIKDMIFKLSGRKVKSFEPFNTSHDVVTTVELFEGRTPVANPANTTVFYFGTITLNMDMAYSPIVDAPTAIFKVTYPEKTPDTIIDIRALSGATAGLKQFDYQLFDVLFNFGEFHTNVADNLHVRYAFTGFRIEVS